MINHSSPRDIDRLLRERGLSPKKRFGQNFLVNAGARASLISRIEELPHRRVWEIGPGIGSLSGSIAEIAEDLTLFEIDRGFVGLLDDSFGARPGIEIVLGDFSTTWRRVRSRSGDPDLIVGNLPYNAAARFILDLFAGSVSSRLLFTVQREAAVRMMARSGDSEFSSFSVICQTGWNITRRQDLRAGSFYPVPRVSSSVVELTPAPSEFPFPRQFLLDFCRCLFHARRKTVRNNLKSCECLGSLGDVERIGVIEQVGIDPESRAEELAPELVVDTAAQYWALRGDVDDRYSCPNYSPSELSTSSNSRLFSGLIGESGRRYDSSIAPERASAYLIGIGLVS